VVGINEKFREGARTFDSWRIFPRAFILSYIYILFTSVDWFMTLDLPSTQQAGFVSTIIGTGAVWFGLYVNSGSNQWQSK
jgi:hypothetical protein